MSLRIGRTVIDTCEWSVQDYDVIIRDLCKERVRKARYEELKNRMAELLTEAKEDGFDFIDKDYGNVFTPSDFELYDTQ